MQKYFSRVLFSALKASGVGHVRRSSADHENRGTFVSRLEGIAFFFRRPKSVASRPYGTGPAPPVFDRLQYAIWWGKAWEIWSRAVSLVDNG